MSKTARDEDMNDVLASIRRLVAEESDRAPEGQAPTRRSQDAARPKAQSAEKDGSFLRRDPSSGKADADEDSNHPASGVFPDRGGEPKSSTRSMPRRVTPQRHNVNKAARAKLLLTDDFLVADQRRWEADAPADTAVDEDTSNDRHGDAHVDQGRGGTVGDAAYEEHSAPTRAQTRSTVARGRSVYQDADQRAIDRDVDAFLKADREITDFEITDHEITGRDQGDGHEGAAEKVERAEDKTLDERVRARAQRAEERRRVSQHAADATRDSAARRQNEADTKDQEDARIAHRSEHPARPSEEERMAARPTIIRQTMEAAPASAPPKAPDLRRAPNVEHAAPTGPMVPLASVEEAVRASLAAHLKSHLPTEVPAHDGELVLDEETLRDMVSDIVKQELQGSLGERITRNVRKLVRREIYRALESRDLG